MSEKQQGTTHTMREKMLNRYGDEYHHKHDKNHTSHRNHCRSHPAYGTNHLNLDEAHGSTGLLRTIKLRKMRKRLDKGRFH